ncbi:MAG: hypothetical protein WCA28_07730 [Bradyrhizobium sp.]
MNTPTLTPPATQGQSAPRRYRPWRIHRPIAPLTIPAPPTAAQLATQFNIRIERAICAIARSGTNTRAACRSVGLIGSEAERIVRRLCDDRAIPRKRYFGGPYRLLASPDCYVSTIARERRRVREETAERVGQWRKENAERQRELSKVAQAIQNYDIERGPCALCGSAKHVVAGPVTLAPKLRVEWRCRKCSNAARRMRV